MLLSGSSARLALSTVEQYNNVTTSASPMQNQGYLYADPPAPETPFTPLHPMAAFIIDDGDNNNQPPHLTLWQHPHRLCVASAIGKSGSQAYLNDLREILTTALCTILPNHPRLRLDRNQCEARMQRILER
ncbi:hypothetical protein DFH27DRAFT_615672 [Peziza echinospora]|nr:hypothetical protein DFH27DRAFT_615672 [Peziza echinospora]